MNVLILTRNGVALGLAQRLSSEGHEVSVFSDTLKLDTTGKGLYQLSSNLFKSVQECKFIVTDSGNWPALYKRAKTYNKPIIGCSEISDDMNLDCVKEYEMCTKLGISTPVTEIYDDSSDIQPKLLDGKVLNYFIKYDRKSFACSKPEWLAWAMYNMPTGKRILLQECVQGNDISVIGWFNGLNWIYPFFYASPYSDKIGATMMLAQKKSHTLTKNTIQPLDKFLKIIDYKGPVTVDIISDGKKVFVKKISIGITAPCVFAMTEGLHEIPLGDFLNSLAFGNESSAKTLNDYLLGIEINARDRDMHGAPLLGVKKENLNHIFLRGVYKQDDSYLVSGEVSTVYTAAAFGRDLSEAANRVYRTIREVQFPQMRYVTNMEGRSSTTLGLLSSWGAI